MRLYPVTTPLNYLRTSSPSPPSLVSSCLIPILTTQPFSSPSLFFLSSTSPHILLLSIRAAKWQTALCKTRLSAGQTGNVRAQNTFAALILIGCRDVKQLRSANEIVLFKCKDNFYIWSTTRTSNIFIPFILTTFVCIHWGTFPYHSFMPRLC